MDVKRIVIVASEKALLLDAAGPAEVFEQANKFLALETPAARGYSIEVVSSTKENSITTSIGLEIRCSDTIYSLSGKIDTLLIAGVKDSSEGSIDRNLVEWVKSKAPDIRRVGSICAGAFLLAEAGLLNGKNATTHWVKCQELQRRYPNVRVDPDPIFVKDGNIYTSAGVSAGMDLALALVEEDFGTDLALHVARRLVLFLRRPGNQSQFSVFLSHQKTDHGPIKQIQKWVLEHLGELITVEGMAEEVAMSPRNFARVFIKETGITPGKYVERLRLEAARRRLEESHLTIEEIASECGFGSADTMRRLFLRSLKVTPGEYRRSFRTAWEIKELVE